MTGRKRQNGQGSVYLRKSDGRWVACLPYINEKGEPKRAYDYCLSEDQAKAALEKLRDKWGKGIDLGGEKQTLAQFLRYWLKNEVLPNRSYGTYESYEVQIRLHIVPTLGNIQLAKLTRQRVHLFTTARKGSARSRESARQTIRVLHTALKQAVDWDLILRNPADGIVLPKVRQVKLAFDRAQALSFVEAIRQHRLEALFYVALSMGLRRGELLGLSWKDVDLDNRTMYIRQALKYVVREHRLLLVQPKTASSVAELVIGASVVEMLRAHRVRQLEERMLAGNKWKDWENASLVFTNLRGGPLWPGEVTKVYHKVLEAASLPRMRLHDLRRSCGTLLLAQGVPLELVQEQLRHASINTTRSEYVDVLREVKERTADAMDDLMNKSKTRTGA